MTAVIKAHNQYIWLMTKFEHELLQLGTHNVSSKSSLINTLYELQWQDTIQQSEVIKNWSTTEYKS